VSVADAGGPVCRELDAAAGADLRIALGHNPSYARLVHSCGGVDLALAGHTHGGQVVLPLLSSGDLPARGALPRRRRPHPGRCGALSRVSRRPRCCVGAHARVFHFRAVVAECALTGGLRGSDNARHPFMPSTPGIAAASEEELVERFRATGEDCCFEELYRRSRRRVFGVCLRVVGDLSQAEDLCHDAFLRAFQGFGRFEGTTFASWVCRIGINLSLNALRRRSLAERAAREPEPAVVPASAERRLVSREALARAASIIEGLEPRQRRVFLLRHLDELSHAAIAARTGWSADEVRSFLQNARRNFRLAWEAAEGERPGARVSHG